MEVIECARGNDAPEDIMMVLEKIADREYNNPAEVSKEIGKTM